MTDAERYRWLKQHLFIHRESSEWTCALMVAYIPYRLDPKETNPDVLIDELATRFPLHAE